MTKLMLALACALILPASAMAEGEAEPTPEDMIAQMEAQCAANSEVMAARQAESPLYDRLGGYEKINALTTKIIELHEQNEAIQHLMDGVDGEALARHVADFMASGTGGPQKYTGRDMVSAHEHLKLTDADFLSAGGDIVKAMKSFDYGEE